MTTSRACGCVDKTKTKDEGAMFLAEKSLIGLFYGTDLLRSKQITHADSFFRSVGVCYFILLECN